MFCSWIRRQLRSSMSCRWSSAPTWTTSALYLLRGTHTHTHTVLEVPALQRFPPPTSSPLPPVFRLALTAACVRWRRSCTRSKAHPTTTLQRQMLTPCWGLSWSSWMGSKKSIVASVGISVCQGASLCKKKQWRFYEAKTGDSSRRRLHLSFLWQNKLL